MNTREPRAAPARQPPLLLRMLLLALTGGALVFVTRLVTTLPCWAVFLLAGMLAWPIWLYRTEYRLFHRRLLLEGVMQPGSLLRPLLWKGTLIKIVQTLAALLLVWLLLALVSRMSAVHGYVLALDAAMLALIIQPVRKRLSATVLARHRPVVARHWPLMLLNTAILTAVIMWLDFAIVGSADTRQLAWHEVATGTFSSVNDAAGCVLWGASAGVLAAIEALSWHVSALLIPGLPNTATQLAGWGFFLLRAATVAWLYTTLLLGIDIMIERRAQQVSERARDKSFSIAFLLTIVLLAAPFYYASVKLQQLDPASLTAGVNTTAQQLNPCITNPVYRTHLQSQLGADIENTREQAKSAADNTINLALARIFTDISAGVDNYLDWYFSVLGEYQRLATAFSNDTAAALREQLEQHLFADIQFRHRLATLNRRIVQQSAGRFAELAPALAANIQDAPCETGPLNLTPLQDLERDKVRASIAATSGVGAGIMTSKVLASKTVAAVAGKITAKASLKGGAALASKTLAKKGSSSLLSAGTGTALCAPGGPLAILCGVTAGTVTWLTVDTLLVEFDEAFHREAMRADILQVLTEQQAVLAEQLSLQHSGRIDLMAAHLDATVERSFIPYTDGINRP